MFRAPRFAFFTLAVTSIGCARPAVAPHGAALVRPSTCGAPVALHITPEPRAVPAEALVDTTVGLVRPCREKTPEHQSATAELEAFDQRLRDLDDDADAGETTAELESLLGSPCFALSAGDPHDALAFDSGVALKAWWDAGGESWVEHYLTLDANRTAVFPPSPRPSLVKSAKTKDGRHPLSPLLCPPSEVNATGTASCGRETAGWVKRAERSFERRAAADRGRYGGGKTEEECAKEASVGDADERYSTFLHCLDDVSIRQEALPVGAFKAPADGWLVLSGGRSRSGRGCDEVRAYDLATGSAYVVRQCGPAALAGTASSPIKSEAGRIPVASLREAAWMLLVAPLVQANVRSETSSFAVPNEIPIVRPEGHGSLYGTSGGCGTSSSIRSWSWMREKNGKLVGQASGQLHWPSACGAAEDHAAEVLGIAEDGFEDVCGAAAPPTNVTWSQPGPAVGRSPAALLDDPATSPVRTALPSARVSCRKR